MDAFDTIKRDGYTIELHYDENPFNPREDYDNEGTLMVQFSDRYAAPSKADKDHPLYDKVQEAWEHGSWTWRTNGVFTGTAHNPEKVERYCRAFLGAAGVQWWDDPRGESRMIVLVFGDSDYTEPQNAAKAIMGEYAAFATGEAYSYTVTRDRDGEVIGSCGGFFGDAGQRDMTDQANADVDADRESVHAERTAMFRRLINTR